jgi:DNA polymerase-1
MSNRLYLLDANGLIAHAHFSISDLSSHMTAEEGVRNWWESFDAEFSPVNVAACFDCSRETNWRKGVSVEYKTARDSKPTDLAFRAAIRLGPKIFDALGLPVIFSDTMEADDVIATLADAWPDEVVIVSHDKDLLQLVDDRVRVFDPVLNKAGECVFYDEARVLEKMHVPPHRVRELLAIMGDSSDSIPGVEGWGKVAAVTAINQTRSRLEIFRLAAEGKLKDISAAKQKNLVSRLRDFEISFELVGLRTDAVIPDVTMRRREIIADAAAEAEKKANAQQ